MKRHALMVILLGAFALLVAALAPPGGTAGQPQPTMVLSPSSGPCDATVEVTGAGFPASSLTESLGLYLLRPGTTDVNVGILNAAVVGQDGRFDEWVPLREHGCEEAALDARAQPPAGDLLIAARSGQTAVPPGDRIPNIIAVAQYTYTTTTPQPQPTMALSPASGPCDGTVEVTGRDFSASTAIHLDVGGGGGESTLGKLASLVTDSGGEFALDVSLGALGCEGAQWIEGLGPGPKEFMIFAEREEPVMLPGQQGVPGFLTSTAYTYTTTVSTAPQALPSTGSGPEQRSTRPMWLLWVAGLAGVGLVLVAGLLYGSRRLRS